jgi:hypothetical protein
MSDAGKAAGAPKRRKWPVVLGVAGGLVVGALAVAVLPAFTSGGEEAPPLPQPETQNRGSKKDGPKLSGDLHTTIRDFTLEDPEGNVVLKVAKIGAFLDLDSIGDTQLVRMPRGTAEDVDVLLRRGPSGRVSLSEAFRGNSEAHEPKKEKGGTPLQIGPMQVKDVKMTVAMGKSPVIIRIDRATIRIQRKVSDLAPRIFLSNVHGEMLQPACRSPSRSREPKVWSTWRATRSWTCGRVCASGTARCACASSCRNARRR